MKSPFENRDLHTILRFPTLSWSSINQWQYDKEKWYQSYVLGVRGPSNPSMDAGRTIGERIATDPSYLPTIPRGGIFEKEFSGRLSGLDLVGHLDQYWPKEGIDEFKTSLNLTRWTQEKVDAWGQITLYCLLVWLNDKVRPEELRLRLFSIPLQEQGNFEIEQFGDVQTFQTRRTMQEVLRFGAEIKAIHSQMRNFVAEKQNLR